MKRVSKAKVAERMRLVEQELLAEAEKNRAKEHTTAINHADALVKLTKGVDRELALELRNRLMLPMEAVIDKLPGLTMSAKAATAGVSRQTLYDWKNRENRPTPKQAKKLALLTYIAADKIMGRRR